MIRDRAGQRMVLNAIVIDSQARIDQNAEPSPSAPALHHSLYSHNRIDIPLSAVADPDETSSS